MKRNEEDEQSALFEYAGLQKAHEWSLLFSIPNGGYWNKKTGARMKKTGLKAGIPDIFLPVASGGFMGMFIEMKSEKGVVQKNQKAWHILLRAQVY